jgi:copper transport protein
MRMLRTALCAAAAGLVLPATAGAHAVLAGATPADGARLHSAPHVIQLRFDERISGRFRSVQLLAADGRKVPGVRVHAASENELVVTVPRRLHRGAYAVVWHVVAEDDGHATGGTLSFGIGVAALRSSASSTAPPAMDIAIRWLRFAFTALLVGGLAFVSFVLPTARPWLDPQGVGRAARRILAAAIAGGAGALAVQAIALARQAEAVAAASATSWTSAVRDLASGSRWGMLWLATDAIVAVLVALAVLLRRHAPAVPAQAAVVAVLAAAALAGVTAAGSHAASLPDGRAAVAVDALHVLAAGIWIGSLAALAVALPAVGRFGPFATVIGRRFALLVGSATSVLVGTGLYSAGVQVVSVDALLTTLYGRVLMAKTLLVVVCCGLGAANFLAFRLPSRRIARAVPTTLGMEAVVGAGVLLAAAVLTASAPARGPEFAPPRPVRAPTLAAAVSDVVLSVTIAPNRPGANFVTVVAASSRRPAPAPIRGVRAGTSPLRHVGADRWVGTVELAAPGDAALRIRVDRAAGDLSARVAWRVAPADPARPVRYSSRRLSTLLDPVIAVLLGAVAIVAAGALLVRLPLPRLTREEHV